MKSLGNSAALASRRTRLAAGCAALAALLAGCQAQPVVTPVQPEYVALAPQAHSDLYFQPGAAELARGEAGRLRGFLQALVLRPSDDVLVDVNSTGSPVLDRRRLDVARAAVGPVPARVRITGPRDFGGADRQPNVAFVQVLRYGTVYVDCKNYGLTAVDLNYFTRIPAMGCANAINRALMTASPRDLTAPQELDPASSPASIAAVQRYRDGTTKPPPFRLGTSD